ncbi:autotransporter outer membrane beta-barrel domain-containing protein [Aureimonas fodinaquatilis]|uniref:Autotransporter outer membrane beta-barrel domain-containing protein n=1 Tax=Aureimonas fodinaquatilis TaxID=2565783 RepID=A0A5B0DSC0_9HYPH|nr:autotransporter domain-containing protein [Aureimonas fodinaquatilis]KAA0968885.1 autotransporter outer membrane beta-barrel domain-containing protein [Aureimonas fodinaquatilis]
MRPFPVSNLQRGAACGLGFCLAALTQPVFAQSAWTAYDGYTSSALVPFSNGGGAESLSEIMRTGSPRVGVSIGTYNSSLLVDTGSTGIGLEESYLSGAGSGFRPTGEYGLIYYSSSNLVAFGEYYEGTVTFNAADGTTVSTGDNMRVLGVRDKVCLPGAPNACDASGSISMMGVGFGRNTMIPGVSAGLDLNTLNPSTLASALATPQAYNPFVNIAGMQAGGTMRAGYIVTQAGFVLGLTASNTAGYAIGQLGRVTDAANAQAYSMQPMAVSVAFPSGHTVGGVGQVLMDTGVTDGFLYLEQHDFQNAIAAGSTITVDLLGSGGAVGYSFVVDPTDPSAPNPMNWAGPRGHTASYLNASVRAFHGMNLFYDAVDGFVGVLPNQNATASNPMFRQVLVLNGALAPQADLSIGVPTILAGATTLAPAAASTTTLANGVGGSGSLIVAGAGTVALAGFANYTGGTTVQSGSLNLTGTIIGDVAIGSAGTFLHNGLVAGSVQSAGTLSGTGQILGGVTTLQGSALAAGNSIGTLTIAGDLSLGSGTTYVVEIDGVAQSDRIDVGGRAQLGGDVSLLLFGTDATVPALGTRFTILTAAGGIDGQFATIDDSAVFSSAYPFLAADLIYTPQSVLLSIGRSDVSFATAGTTDNQRSVGFAADSLPLTSATIPLVSSLAALDMRSASSALESLSGGIHADLVAALAQESRHVRQAAMNRLRDERSAQIAPLAQGSDIGEPGGLATGWVQAFGGWGRLDGTGAGHLNQDTGGVLLGIDGAVGDAGRVGLLTGWSSGTLDSQAIDASSRSDSYHIGLYAGTNLGEIALRGGASYSNHQIETNRTISFPGFVDAASASYDGYTAQLFAELGYETRISGILVEPFVNLTQLWVRTDSFAEAGGPAALSGNGSDYNSTLSTLGLRSYVDVDWRDIRFTIGGLLGWQHSFGDLAPQAGLSLASIAPFTIEGSALSRDAALLSVGIDAALTEAVSLGVSYDGRIGTDDRDHAIQGRFTYRF